MHGISEKGGLISYYGNPAGYTDKGNVIVDRIFQNEELTNWLTHRNLTPKWTDGVMECLMAGEQLGGVENSAPLKNVRIWQLGPETDVCMKFISLDEMTKKFGEPNPEHYRVAYDGRLGTNDLEAIFTRCNTNHPPGYNGHSLSMSDVVELYDEGGSEFHYCDHYGFKSIAFEPQEQTQGMEMQIY
mgnify:CR=1 FL=1